MNLPNPIMIGLFIVGIIASMGSGLIKDWIKDKTRLNYPRWGGGLLIAAAFAWYILQFASQNNSEANNKKNILKTEDTLTQRRDSSRPTIDVQPGIYGDDNKVVTITTESGDVYYSEQKLTDGNRKGKEAITFSLVPTNLKIQEQLKQGGFKETAVDAKFVIKFRGSGDVEKLENGKYQYPGGHLIVEIGTIPLDLNEFEIPATFDRGNMRADVDEEVRRSIDKILTGNADAIVQKIKSKLQ